MIYNFSEGTDKVRLSKEMVPYQLEGYTTVFLSVGEFSILEACKSKADGLRSRVMEIEGTLTASAAHADRIKAACRRHNGWAAPMMANYIIYNMGMKKVLEVYGLYCKALKENWPDTPGKERFVSKFAALFLTAADIAEPALGIKFDLQGILDFIVFFISALPYLVLIGAIVTVFLLAFKAARKHRQLKKAKKEVPPAE